jgi:hypothetical protein
MQQGTQYVKICEERRRDVGGLVSTGERRVRDEGVPMGDVMCRRFLGWRKVELVV